MFPKLGQKGLLNWMSDELYIKLMYYSYYNKKLDLKNPVTFNEKLQYLKLNDRKKIYTNLVDKQEVKKYISEKLGEEYVIPTINVWNSVEEINWQTLPNQFVIKATHDSARTIICKDKKNFDFEHAV